MSQVKITDNESSLRLSIKAYAAVISDYSLRTKQAEEMVGFLMRDKIPKDEFIRTVVNKIEQHVEARGIDRATQYLGLLQTTLMALTSIQKKTPNPELLEIIKALTLAIGQK